MYLRCNLIETVEITGTYIDEVGIIPEPNGNGFYDCVGYSLASDIMQSVMKENNCFEDGAIDPKKTSEVVTTMHEIFKDELFAACSDELSQQTKNDVIAPVVAYASPSPRDISSAPDEIHTEQVIFCIAYNFLQTVFDRLNPGESSDGATHMTVENVLDIKNCKWSEPMITNEVHEDVTHTYRKGSAVELSGEFLSETVVIPVPHNSCMNSHEACKGIEEVFSHVIDDYNMGETDTFTAIRTNWFERELKRTVKELLVTVTSIYGSECEQTIQSAVDDAFPPSRIHRSLPDKIHTENVIMHITRMVLQTALNNIRDTPTQMGVDNPFDISAHKWDETTIE